MNEKTVILVSAGIFFVLVAIAVVFSSNFVLSSNIILIGIAVLVIPYYIYKFFEFKRIRAYEREFPNFLRDLAESQRAGLTILQAIQNSSKSNYGLLTDEVKKMNHQMSWNVPLETILNEFAKRTRKSRTITRSIMIIEQANKSGGNVEDTMDSLASNMELLKEVKEEKSALLNQHMIMMYAIFFIFLGISITLIKFLIPLLQTTGAPGTEGSTIFGLSQFQSNPCYECISSSSPACMGCSAFFAVSATFGFGEKEDAAAYYRALFFTMIVVQGFFTGLIAGQISADSIIAGIKHSLIMLLSGIFIFIAVIRFGFI